MTAWAEFPTSERLLAWLRLSTAQRGYDVAHMALGTRVAWELAYARHTGRGIPRAREEFDAWVSAYCDLLNAEVML